MAEALTEVANVAARLSAARERLNEAKAELDAAIAELDARARRLRRAGADHDMPVGPGEVDAVERAAGLSSSAPRMTWSVTAATRSPLTRTWPVGAPS